MEYAVIVERGGKNGSAYAPDVPGCVATGRTVEETLQNMHEALRLHFQAMVEDGERIPEPTCVAAQVDVEGFHPLGPVRAVRYVPMEYPVWTPPPLTPGEGSERTGGEEVREAVPEETR